MRFKIDWASLIVGSKFTVFALFYFVFEGNFPSTSPRGGLYLEGRFNGGFFCVTGFGGLYLEGLIHGGAYFRNFTVHEKLLNSDWLRKECSSSVTRVQTCNTSAKRVTRVQITNCF